MNEQLPEPKLNADEVLRRIRLRRNGVERKQYLVQRFRNIPSLKDYVGHAVTEDSFQKIIDLAVLDAPEGYEFYQIVPMPWDGIYFIFKLKE